MSAARPSCAGNYSREVISPSLLKRINSIPLNRPLNPNFDLGMGDWMDPPPNSALCDKENSSAPPAKRKKLSLAKPDRNKERFSETISQDELEKMSKGFVPDNTAKNTKWATTVFSAWLESRNCRTGESTPTDYLDRSFATEESKVDLARVLSLFAVEAKKKDGTSYPAKTVYHLLSGILRYMREKDPYAPNFLDQKDGAFKKLHGTMDTHFRALRQQGVGAKVNHAKIITSEEECLMWERGVMGTTSPLALLRAVFYYNGKKFLLRGGAEHRGLKFSQLQRTSNAYIYTENGSKNRSGGLAQLRVENKVVPSYAVHEAGERCHVALLDLYFSKVPSEALQKDNFYLRPLQKKPEDPNAPWFMSMQVGVNTINQMLSKMCEQAGLEHRTNHSLRATGASDMFQANLPEHVIQSRTGHLSLKALRTYERVTEEQQQEACKVLTPISTNHLHVQAAKHEQMVAKESPPNAVTNALFGNPQNCTINVQVYNNPSFQQCQFQGMTITTQEYVDSRDDQLVDSILCDADYDV